ncbi:universal stress protein [Parasphingopyxis algicola]|uniref:universal stress protein n=1 Tax=Parasphingopyxis algicola TaxID=2026624 RepID=UPI0015A07EF8|nr:universal stress protein [Parasphingopyxis algicola]QLC24697.1 universal stress protein [Parasphingopyxis algicola]
MRSILIPVNDEEGFESRLQAALDVGRAVNGHISFLHGIPVSDYVALDPFGGSYYVAEQREAALEEAERKRTMLKEEMGNEDVPWDFVSADGAPDDVLVGHSRLADVAVLSEPAGNDDDLASSVTYFVMEAQCPILAVPQTSKALHCAGKAVVAWNGSAPAANAMRAAIPMLQVAESVEVVTIGEDPRHFPAASACAYLSRHGIKADLILRDRRDKVSEAMHDLLLDRDADYMVMGAYGHSRLRQTLFGGVSRHFIQRSPVPVFMTH